MPKFHVVQNEAGEGGDGGAGTGEVKTDPNIELLTKSVGLLAQGLQKMEENQNAIVSKLGELGKAPPIDDKKVELKDPFENVDLEQLTPKQIIEMTLKLAREENAVELAKVQKAADEKVDSLAQAFSSKNANEQVGAAIKDHADFWEWKDDIKSVLSENPNLNVQRAYKLARAEAPEKAAEMDKKYAKADDKPTRVLSLFPTSYQTTKSQKMTPKEAAEKAFDSVMGEFKNQLTSDQKIA